MINILETRKMTTTNLKKEISYATHYSRKNECTVVIYYDYNSNELILTNGMPCPIKNDTIKLAAIICNPYVMDMCEYINDKINLTINRINKIKEENHND